MKIVPLGTNGFFPSFKRATACYAIPFKNKLIILDAGSGLFRLAEPIGRRLLEDIDEAHLYLSHYHLDHAFGFYAAFKLLQGKKVTVFSKLEKKVFADLEKDYFPIDYGKEHKNFSWQMIKEGENKIGDYIVRVRKQKHMGSGSLAFRFNFPEKSLAYITDSEPTNKGVDFVQGVDILLHEHYLSGEEVLRKRKVKLADYFLGKHVTTVGAAIIAKDAKVGKLALIHHFPFYDDKKLSGQLKIAKSIFPNTILAQDLKEIKI